MPKSGGDTRHWCFQTCLRETGDRALAEDASQVVFVLLARKASQLHGEGTLAGWLFRAALFVSQGVMRQERRRRAREMRAVQDMAVERELRAGNEALWNEIAPHLNSALARLNPADREAILLRCLQGHSLAETGNALGVTENTARMRVSRALDKLRAYLTKTGIVVSLSTLAVLLAERGAQAAPVSLTQAIAHIAAASSVGTGGTAFVTSKAASAASHTAPAHVWIKGVAVMAISTAKTVAGVAGATLALLVIGETVIRQTARFFGPQAGWVQVAVVPKDQVASVQNMLSKSGVSTLGTEVNSSSPTEWHIMVPPKYADKARLALVQNRIGSSAETQEKRGKQ